MSQSSSARSIVVGKSSARDRFEVPDGHPLAGLIREYERWRAARIAADPLLEPTIYRRAKINEDAARLMLAAALLEWCAAGGDPNRARPFGDRKGMRYTPIGDDGDMRREPVKRRPGPAGSHAEYRELRENRTIAVRRVLFPQRGRGKR